MSKRKSKRRRKSFSDQIRDAVERSEKTRYRISRDTGIDAGALCNFVKNRRGISLDTLDTLAEYLGLRVEVDE